jgi:tetratricopeptide (TPR) repeat protein
MSGQRRRVVVDESALAKRIGMRIRAARQLAGLTQQQVAEGRYTKAYISALETGHAKPSMAALNFIGDRLGMPSSSFLADDTARWSRVEADLLLASGRWTEAVDAYDSLLPLTQDRAARAELLRGRAEALCRLEQGHGAIAAATESVELFEHLGRTRDAALATYWLAYAQYLAGNSIEARSLLTGLLEGARRSDTADPDLRVRALMALGSVAAAQEDHGASLAYLEEAGALAQDLDDWRRAAFLSLLAGSYAEVGDTEGAIRTGIESLALFRGAEAQREAAILENNLALAYLRVGNLSRASELAADARVKHQQEGDRRSLAHVVETEAQIALAQGAVAEAEALAVEAIDHARASSNPRALASALLTIGRAQVASQRLDDALETYARAAGELRTSGPVARLQQALAEWADLLASMGRHVEAYELTREALRAAAPRIDQQGPRTVLSIHRGAPQSGPAPVAAVTAGS